MTAGASPAGTRTSPLSAASTASTTLSGILDMFGEPAAEGMTMVLATHEMTFPRDVSDIVCFLADGSICESGSPGAVLANPQEQRTQAFLRRILPAQRI